MGLSDDLKMGHSSFSSFCNYASDVMSNKNSSVWFHFQKAFNGPLQKLGQLLFDHIQRADRSTQVSEHITERQLKKVCKEILGLFTENQQHQYYFDLFSQGSGSLSREGKFQQVSFSFFHANIYLAKQKWSVILATHVAYTLVACFVLISFNHPISLQISNAKENPVLEGHCHRD